MTNQFKSFLEIISFRNGLHIYHELPATEDGSWRVPTACDKSNTIECHRVPQHEDQHCRSINRNRKIHLGISDIPLGSAKRRDKGGSWDDNAETRGDARGATHLVSVSKWLFLGARRQQSEVSTTPNITYLIPSEYTSFLKGLRRPTRPSNATSRKTPLRSASRTSKRGTSSMATLCPKIWAFRFSVP